MSDQDISAEPESPTQPLPGRLLREAREAQGLTLGEVAGTLKFSTRQIEALENDDFQQLQGKTFLRGFIRAYARMLRLAPEPLLDMLEADALPPDEQIVAPANMGETNKMPFYRRHVRKLVLAVFALVLAGAGFFIFSTIEPQGEHHIQTVEVPATAENVAPSEAVQNLSPAMAAVPALSGTVAQSAPTATTLVFEFSDRSWLEVKDADGQTLLTGEFPGGQTQTIAGKPPYQLWVGKVSAVKVSYGGKVVDLQPFTREEVARLTLE